MTKSNFSNFLSLQIPKISLGKVWSFKSANDMQIPWGEVWEAELQEWHPGV